MTLRPALVAVACALLLSACASGGNPEPTTRTVVVGDEGAVRSTVTPGTQQSFAAPESQVWTALAAAYASLGLTVDVNDAQGHRIGRSNFYFTGRVNGQPISHFANCGSGMTGPIADNRRVYFSAITSVTAVDATHTTLVTDVEPTAVDVAGGASDRITCGSTGALETMLYDAVTRQLGSP